MSRLGFVVVCFSLCAVVAQPVARACTASPPLYSTRTVLPSDGAVGVATNARVLVVYYWEPLNADSPRLRTSGGDEVAASVALLAVPQGKPDTYLIQPNEPLQPNTSYQVLSQIATLPCGGTAKPYPYAPLCNPPSDGGVVAYDGGETGGGGSKLTVVSTFTTGAGPDTAAPVFPGNLTHTSQQQRCDNGACCGPYNGYLVTFNWQNPVDSSPVYYELSQGGSPVLFDFDSLNPASSSTSSVSGQFFCTKDGWIMGTSFSGVAGDYSLVAVDLAGNRSTALTDHVRVDCNASGCSCHLGGLGARASGIGIAAFALLLTLGWRRRNAER